MFLHRGNRLPGSLGWLFALLVAAPAGAQTAPSAPQQVHILVKQAMPELGATKVAWSDDGRYVVIAPEDATLGVAWQAVVYDTNFGAEIRRLYGTPDGKPSRSVENEYSIVFAHHSSRLFVQGDSGILSCALETQDPCDIVLRGHLSNLALSQDDHIATLRDDDPNTTLVYFDPLNPATAKSYQLHLPVENDALGGHFSLAFFPQSGVPAKIGLAAVTSYAYGDPTRRKLDHSFISIVDLKGCDGSPVKHCIAEFQFDDMPLWGGSLAFTADGKPLLCGYRNTSKPPRELSDTIVERGIIYDPTAKRELSEKSFGANVPAVFTGCLGKQDPNVFAAGLDLTRKGGPMINILYSPRRNVMLFTHRTESNGLELYTQQLPAKGPKPSPVLLASASVTMNSVAVYPSKLTFATQGTTARYWNAVTGDVTDESHAAVFNLRGDFANFFYDSNTKKYALWTGKNGQRGAAAGVTEVHPSWLGISADGNSVAYADIRYSFGLNPDPHFVVNNVSKSTPPCYDMLDSNPLTLADISDYVRQRYIFSPIAAAFFLFCDHRRPDDKVVTHLYRWDIPSLNQSLDIVANDNRNWIAPSPDGKLLVFGGFTSARLLDLVTGAVRDLDVGIQPQKWIAFSDHIIGAELLNDNTTLVLAITQAGGTRAIKLFDVVTGASQQFNATDSPIKSISTDHNNRIVLASNDNLISIFDKSGKRLLRLAAIGSYDWLAFSDSGRFDGTPAALKAVAYQSAPDTPAITANQLFNELYTPGLLVYAWSGGNLDLTPGISMTTYLELPGTAPSYKPGSRTTTTDTPASAHPGASSSRKFPQAPAASTRPLSQTPPASSV